MNSKADTTIEELLFSPLKKWRHEHCHQCSDTCRPCEERFTACILCDLADAIKRIDKTAKHGGYSQ